MPSAATKEHAHELIDRMAPEQVSEVIGLLEIILDPFARALANAPYDDEPTSEEASRLIGTHHNALARGEGISNDDLLAEFGLTAEDFKQMGRTSLKAPETSR